MMVFALDRDWTVDVNPPPGEREAVPLEWVRYLARETAHEVWAIGNQDLKAEADIPGIVELAERYYDEGIERLGGQDDYGYYEFWPLRRERLRMLAGVFPDAAEYIVVDDLDLGDVEGWRHYHAWEFVPAVKRDEIRMELPPKD